MQRGSDILARPGSQPCRKRRNPSSLRGHSSTPSSRGCRLELSASMTVPETQWNLVRRHTSGPVGHNMFSDCEGNEAAQEGITGGSEDSEEGADRLAEEGAASDASAVGDNVAELDGAAGGEMLARLHEDAQEEHREACLKAVAAVLEADHG